ncbi:MAG: hypothetical protein H6742_18135 [Alphaproteobacteria bacterium]|nr:hypothetical protein [Alphaproteobacteria bacterium]
MADPDLDAVLAAFLAQDRPDPLPPAGLRLARALPAVVAHLDPREDDPVRRALLGLDAPPDPADLDDLGRAVLSGVAAMDGGQAVAGADQLEARAEGDPTWWALAAQVAVASDVEREQAARMRLSVQDLPYVFPGDLHAVQIEVLAVGPRVMPALHVDWARKLSGLAADALVLDLRALGLWFWPVLRSLATDRLTRPVAKLPTARRLPSGALGIAAAYAFRVGVPWAPALKKADDLDRLLAALAIIGDRPV